MSKKIKIQVTTNKKGKPVFVIKGDHGGTYLLTPSQTQKNMFHLRHLNKKMAKLFRTKIA